MPRTISKETAIAARRTLIALAALLTAASQAPAQPAFELLDPPGPGPWADFSLSRDGHEMACVVGGAVYWWTEDLGFRFLDPGVPTGGGVGMAADGSALVAARAVDGGAVPALWFRDGSSLDLGPPARDCGRDHGFDGGFDVSTGGRLAVGQVSTCDDEVAFVWTRSAGLRGLATPGGGTSRGTAVSADGRVVVGYCEHPRSGHRLPVLWRDGGEPEFLLGPQRAGEALGISLDGTRVVGQAELGGTVPQAFCWTATGGAINLGGLGGHARSVSLARAVSDDGRVVGWSGDALFGDQAAFLWTAAAGMRAIADILAGDGIVLPEGMVLTAALDISGDGTTVVGTARDRDWTQHFWRARLGTSVATTPAGPPPAEPLAADPSTPDSMDVQQADMFDLFPFTRRRY